MDDMVMTSVLKQIAQVNVKKRNCTTITHLIAYGRQ